MINHDTFVTYLHIVCFFQDVFLLRSNQQYLFLLSLFIFTSIILVLQACLGSKAKPNEKNLVQVTTTDSSDSTVTFTILSLTSGKSDQVQYVCLLFLQILCCLFHVCIICCLLCTKSLSNFQTFGSLHPHLSHSVCAHHFCSCFSWLILDATE